MNRLVVLSILLNAVLIIAIGGYAYHKRDKIFKKIQSLFKTSHKEAYQSPREIALANFNNEPLLAVNDSMMVGADSTITFLFLGNSLTYTGVPEEEPDKENRGMASTKKEKDYVHVLLKTIADNNHLNIKYSVLNIAQFERTFSVHSFTIEKIKLASIQEPDFLIVQIGENVAREDIVNPEKFETEYIKLLSLFPHSKRIITIPFWPDKEKEYAITNVAIKSNSFLVDISHLGAGTDAKNFAASYRKYAEEGVGAHPGDYGMANIADCIYAIFNAIYCNQQLQNTYSKSPEMFQHN